MPYPSNNFKPFLTYLAPHDLARLKKFAKTNKQAMAQIVREAVNARLTAGNQYVNGFNDGVNKSITAVKNMQPAQMRFPSGQSFAEIVSDELTAMLMPVGEEETTEQT